MEEQRRKKNIFLGLRIGLVFIAALAMVILVAYYALSRNFHNMLTNYTVQLVQSMIGQGVAMVEEELETNKKEITLLADTMIIPSQNDPDIHFDAQTFQDEDLKRFVYITETQSITSDGQERNIKNRQDILDAFSGKYAVYGPYFDTDGQYLVCYTAPVVRDGKIAGVLCAEKDGYYFSRLIENIRFGDSGEAYIINTEGTDIAVSRPEHMDWVNDQYNGRALLAEKEDPVTRSIVELEQKGLNGETGIGTYTWNDGLCYVAYAPVPSTKWVLLAGLREEEITAMTKSTLYATALKGPAMIICFTVFFILAALIVFWIISSTKKNAEINKNLEKIANHDALTGLLNRRFLETDLSERWRYPVKVSGPAAVFMADIDDFKKYNDYYGHQAGDNCLRVVAGVMKNALQDCDSYVIRYGGEEFIAAVFLMEQEDALKKGREICRLVEAEKLPNSEGGCVTISVGISHVSLTSEASLAQCIQDADQAMYQAKKDGKNRAVIIETAADNS